MNDLLQTVLTDPATRSAAALPAALAEVSDNFAPWATIAAPATAA